MKTEKFYTVKTLAERLAVKPLTIYRLVNQGKLPAVRIGRSIRFDPEPTSQYKCDGRTRCSQMTSCQEATFFLKNCPGVEMDGDNDGIPCEKQWCKP